MAMKRRKLRKIWKILILLVVILGIYTGYNKIIKKDKPNVSYSSIESSGKEKPSTNNTTNTNTETKTEEPVEEEHKQEEPAPKRVNVGLYYKNSTEELTINNVYLTNYRTSFKLNENIAIYIDGTYENTTSGTIYITNNGDSYANAFTTLEYNETNLNDGSLIFNLNFEEHHTGYYDIYVINNNTEVAKYVFQIIE